MLRLPPPNYQNLFLLDRMGAVASAVIKRRLRKSRTEPWNYTSHAIQQKQAARSEKNKRPVYLSIRLPVVILTDMYRLQHCDTEFCQLMEVFFCAKAHQVGLHD